MSLESGNDSEHFILHPQTILGRSFGCNVPLLPLDGTSNLRPPESNVCTHRIRFDVHLFAGQPFPGVDLVHAVHGIVRDLRVEEEFQDRRVAGSDW